MSETSYIAKHELVRTQLRQQIIEGRLPAGGKIPSDQELAEEYDCSRGTIRRAVQALVEEGLLRGQQGAGTFVQVKPREKLFGIIVPNLVNPDHARLVSAVTSNAASRGYTTMLCVVEEGHDTPERNPLEVSFIEKMGQMHVAGVVKTPTLLEGHEEEFSALLRKLDVPFVEVNNFWSDCRNSDHLCLDDSAAAEMAVEHLAGLGHRHIAFHDHGASFAGGHRLGVRRAFLDALARRGLPADAELALPGQNEEFAAKFFTPASKTPITAVVSLYYPFACDLLNLLEARGWHVPEDFSLVTLTSVPERRLRHRDMTAMVAPIGEMAKEALDILLRAPEKRTVGRWARLLYRPTLHSGGTTAPLKESCAKPDDSAKAVMADAQTADV